MQRSFCTVVFFAVVVNLLTTTVVWAGTEPATLALQATEISATSGQQTAIKVEQTGQVLPSGNFYTVTATAIAYPGSDEPDILSGFPVTIVTCSSVGQYIIRIKVHLVKKTSCGGASFKTVLEDDVHINIGE